MPCITAENHLLTNQQKETILQIEKVLSAMVSSLWLVNKNDRSGLDAEGGHFLLLKIFHAMSNMPKPTVASSVSRAKVSKSVMEHPPFRICVRGEQQKCVNPRREAGEARPHAVCRQRSRDQYNRRFALFQPGGAPFCFWMVDISAPNGYTETK